MHFYLPPGNATLFRQLCAIWLIIWAIVPVLANKPNVINFYHTDYHAANKNWSIAQDHQGIMYFGNDDGLLEFDGIRWHLYRPPADKLVRSVSVAPDGMIFTGGYEEFGYWQRDINGELTYHSLSGGFKDTFHNDEIWKIWTSDSLTLFQSFGNVYFYDRKTVWKTNPNNNILFLLKVRDEYWAQAMGGALYRLSNQQEFEEIPGSKTFSDTEIRVILPFGRQDYLIGTSTRGIFIYDGVSFRPWDVDFSQQVLSFELNNGIPGRNGHYYFGTILNGLFEVDASGNIVNQWSADNLMQNSTVLSLCEDQSGNIWVGLDRGITFIQYSQGMDYYIDAKGKTGAVYSAALHDGQFYLGTNQGLLVASQDKWGNPDIFQQLKLIDGTQGQVWDLKVVDGQLFCGHNKGLKLVGKEQILEDIEGITTGVYKIQTINYIGNDYLFLGTYTNAQVMKRENGKWRTVHNADLAEIQEPITNIERDHMGNIWLEHARKGVYRCTFSEDMSHLNYVHFYRSRDPGRLRLFKIGERVVFSGNDSIFVYNDNTDQIEFHEGLNRLFNGIKGLKNIITVAPNRFWAMTSNSIYNIQFDGQTSKIDQSYDVNSQNLSLVNDYENIVRLNDTLNLVCLDRGFMLYHGSKAMRRNILASPRLRTITVTGHTGKKTYLDPAFDHYKLNFKQNTLSFDFFSGDVLSQNLFFQTWLEGVDAGWSAPARIHESLFERLPQGDYVFRVRTCNSLNEYSQPATFYFSILPPWYLTPVAYMAYFFIFVLLAVIVWNLWLRRLRNQHLLKIRMREEQRLRRLNDELLQEIDDKNAELLIQTTFIIQKNELIARVKKEIAGFYYGLSGSRAFKPLYEKIMMLLDKNMDMDEDWKIFLIQFEQKHIDFFKSIKAEYTDLTPHDLKLCACLKLNLSSKDIASLMNISLRGVENSRYRLRRKLKLSPTQNLTEFFMRF